jgi:hypothetical protein
MALETGTYISDLVTANPAVGDASNQGDDHLRLIKTCIKNTFTGLTGPVTVNQAQLNFGTIPVGGIILWSGALGTIPTNWHLCDGTTGTPDLRDRFVVGAGSSYAVNAAGGSTTTSNDGSHSHTGSTGGHTLTAGEIPGGNFSGGAGSALTYQTATPAATAAHTHPISADGSHTHTVTPPYFALAYIMRTA